jgi:hypothetical protein
MCTSIQGFSLKLTVNETQLRSRSADHRKQRLCRTDWDIGGVQRTPLNIKIYVDQEWLLLQVMGRNCAETRLARCIQGSLRSIASCSVFSVRISWPALKLNNNYPQNKHETNFNVFPRSSGLKPVCRCWSSAKMKNSLKFVESGDLRAACCRSLLPRNM